MSIDSFIPEVWSAELLLNFERKLVYANLVSRDYEGDVSRAGDTVPPGARDRFPWASGRMRAPTHVAEQREAVSVAGRDPERSSAPLRRPARSYGESHNRAAPNTPDESPCRACTIGVRATSPSTCRAISGGTRQGLITKFAPQLASRVLAKAGAQAVPVLGAAAVASINYIFARYYQELARVQFGLLRLANETGIPREALADRLVMRIKSLEAKKLEGKRSA